MLIVNVWDKLEGHFIYRYLQTFPLENHYEYITKKKSSWKDCTSASTLHLLTASYVAFTKDTLQDTL